jgi:hypothetical protein
MMHDNKTTWREMIGEAMAENGESWKDIVHTTLTDEELDTEFDDGYGGSEGCPFTLWTETAVYFPAVYDGAEWVASVPRNPCDMAMGHVGGE